MKVIFVAPSAYRLGGVQTWLSYLLPGLDRHGFEAHLALVEGDQHDPASYASVHQYDRIVRIAPRQFTPSARCRAIVEVLGDIGPALAVGVNVADLYPAAGELARHGKYFHTVATQHALQADYYADLSFFRDAIDAVICTNRLTERLCRSVSGFEPERVLYAPYGVVQPAKKGIAPGRSVGGERFRIGFAGRLEDSQKRASDLPGILGSLVNKDVPAELIIAGRGPLEERLRADFEKQGLAGQFRFLGHVPAEKMGDVFYQQIDALLITSSWETGPIVAWEAMAHEIPVVSSTYVGHIAEGALIDGTNCKLFPVGDIMSAAAALKSLTIPEVRTRLVVAGSELVKSRYSRAASIKQWAEALERVVALPIKDRRNVHYRLDAPGRLQRLVGRVAADWIRENMLPRKPVASAGAEWPHAYSRSESADLFLRRLAEQEHHGP